MGRMIIIENLGSEATETELTTLLSGHGTVEAIQLATDESSDEGTQVAFVVMQSGRHGRAAIAALDAQTYSGRVLKIRPMKRQAGQAAGPSSAGAVAPGPGGRRGRRNIFGGKSGVYGSKGRGTSGGRNR